MTHDTNPYEERARATKAFKLARVLRLADVDADTYRHADDDFRAYVARKAKVREPSDASWQLAIDTLEAMREDRYLEPGVEYDPHDDEG